MFDTSAVVRGVLLHYKGGKLVEVGWIIVLVARSRPSLVNNNRDR